MVFAVIGFELCNQELLIQWQQYKTSSPCQSGEAKHLPLNRHYRSAKSLFRLGLDMLRRVLLNAQSKHDLISFLLLMTRWQGTTIIIGFLPQAAPTAVAALGLPSSAANYP